jgi:cytosine/adenosine deaminase-related metal-dependent hydrolase
MFFSSPLYFKNVTILTAAGPIGHTLRVKGSRVVALNESPGRNDQIFDGGGGLLIPGLINAHDHLELNTFPRLKYRERYHHSLQWIEDIEARFETDPQLTGPRRQPLAERLLLGGLKNLLSGVTTVCHHNPLHRPLHRGFFIRVVKQYGFCHSLFRGDDPGASYRQTRPAYPWIIHLAEGLNAEAEAEFDQLESLGLVRENTVLVHGVGLTPLQRQTLLQRGGGLIWCPGSNCFLFGQTAQVQALAQAGQLALGSDSRLSGEFDLLAELKVAHETGQLSPQQLFQTVTTNAARLLRLSEGGQGQISLGAPADLVLLPPSLPSDPFLPLVNFNRSQLDLVMIAGRPLVASPQAQPLFEATRTRFIPLSVDGTQKLLAHPIATRLKQATISEPGVLL